MCTPPHQTNIIRTFFHQEKGSDLLLYVFCVVHLKEAAVRLKYAAALCRFKNTETLFPLRHIVIVSYFKSESWEIMCNSYTGQQICLMNQLRQLWGQHVYWTRFAIISTAADLDDSDPVTKRLLRNPKDFAKLFAPIFGMKTAKRF